MPSLSEQQRGQAKFRFDSIVNYFEAISTSDSISDSHYSKPQLIKLTYEYSLSSESKDNFLRAFFQDMHLSLDGEGEIALSELAGKFNLFAENLFEKNFLPLRASSRKTPQQTPKSGSAIQELQASYSVVGTPNRLSSLHDKCFIRDRHRCVITRAFDRPTAIARHKRNGFGAQDDDGHLLADEPVDFAALEVAHILPHSLTKANKDSPELDESRKSALAILNMFDSAVVNCIDGANIDQPYNAITLTRRMHDDFGSFQIFFEAVPDKDHTYRIKTFLPAAFNKNPRLPLERTLFLAEERTIDAPMPRLLAIHRAIAHILHLSGAGEYIEDLLPDLDSPCIRSDGSTNIDRIVKLRLGGWLDGAISA